MMKQILSQLSLILEYQFKNQELLIEALTHPSLSRQEIDRKFNYERLEFLGDSVLGLVIAEMLMDKFSEESEGDLAKRQAGLVRGEAVASIAIKLDIGKFIIMTSGEEQTGGRENHNNLENCLEAIIGAIYKDAGYDLARNFIIKHWSYLIIDMLEPPKDYKTLLQEWAQSRKKKLPKYNILEVQGSSHSPQFLVEVVIDGVESVSQWASSKKKAEKLAAEKLFNIIDGRE